MATIYIPLLFFTSLILSSHFAISTPIPIIPPLIHPERSTVLHFYVQDPLAGPNATVWEVARAEITGNLPTQFGQVIVFDDKLTARPDRNSAEVGRAQGLIASSGLTELALTMNLNFLLTSGEFSGSTVSIVGRNPLNSQERELPVVGGTGKLRMARGYAITNTYLYDPVENYRILEYSVYVYYYG